MRRFLFCSFLCIGPYLRRIKTMKLGAVFSFSVAVVAALLSFRDVCSNSADTGECFSRSSISVRGG